MPLNESPDRADVNSVGLDTKVLSITSASAVELFCGVSRNPRRQVLIITNDDNSKNIFIGKLDVTATGSTKGDTLYPRQTASYPIGDVAIYAIAESGATVSVVIQELS
jgi:hypothetical protein